MSDYSEHLITQAGGDGDGVETRQELARSAKNALNAYAEGYGSYKAFTRAKERLAEYDARTDKP